SAIALVELEPDCPGDIALRLVNGGLQHGSLGGEPEAVIDQLGVFGDETIANVHHLAIQGNRLQGPMRDVQHSAARGLVDAARLHAYEAVLHHVDTANAVLTGQVI